MKLDFFIFSPTNMNELKHIADDFYSLPKAIVGVKYNMDEDGSSDTVYNIINPVAVQAKEYITQEHCNAKTLVKHTKYHCLIQCFGDGVFKYLQVYLQGDD